MKFLASIFGGTFAAKAARETRIADLLREKSILVVANLELLESLEDMKAEAHRHSEAAAAARLRNADLQRRLDATLQALDKARADADVNLGRVVELEIENSDLSTKNSEARMALTAFVTEIRAYQSPECDECDILGPLLKQADTVLGAEND